MLVAAVPSGAFVGLWFLFALNANPDIRWEAIGWGFRLILAFSLPVLICAAIGAMIGQARDSRDHRH